MRHFSKNRKKIFKTSDIAGRLVQPGENVHLINLGCARNLVDAQAILGALKRQGSRAVGLTRADTVIINTCGFIEDAKKESVDVILDALDLKRRGRVKRVIVAGCLSARYGTELQEELSEVDAFVGAARLAKTGIVPQVPLTPRYTAYLKICESCYNRCRFCAIPLIKGPFVSRRMESIVAEARQMETSGVREINIIGQDITAYGMDLYHQKSLAPLLEKILASAKKIEWVRLLYTFPAHITDDLIAVIAREPRVCKYIDVPLQHISDRILTAMGRRFSAAKTKQLLRRIRASIPEVTLRTTFIVGFPGETESNFEELLNFVRETRFEKLGAFIYSREEGTAAYDFLRQVPSDVARKRLDRLMQLQQEISAGIQRQKIGRTMKVLIDARDKTRDNVYRGRTEYDAPDVDGQVAVRSSRRLRPGDFVPVRITSAQDYDLEGESA